MPPIGNPQGLHHFFVQAARAYPDHPAIDEPGKGSVTYCELDVLSDRLRDRLVASGVQRGDRVGICMRKSIDAVASIIGILKTGLHTRRCSCSRHPECLHP